MQTASTKTQNESNIRARGLVTEKAQTKTCCMYLLDAIEERSEWENEPYSDQEVQSEPEPEVVEIDIPSEESNDQLTIIWHHYISQVILKGWPLVLLLALLFLWQLDILNVMYELIQGQSEAACLRHVTSH